MWPPARRSNLSGLAGLVCLILIGLLAIVFPRAALFGWHAGFVFWSSLPIGALFLAMIMQVVPGAWIGWLGGSTRLVLSLMPLTLLAVLPYAFASGTLMSGSETLSGFQGAYLTPWFTGVRSLVLLGGASILALLFTRPGNGVGLASIGLIVMTLAQGLMATDWISALDPEFHSSAFGLYILSIQMVIALSIVILLSMEGTQGAVALPSALLLTGILLWGYLAFMSYFILWSGNLPPGAAWYLRRGHGIWAVAEIVMVTLQAAPAFALLFPPIRRSRRALVAAILAVLFGKYVEIGWLILPELGSDVGMASTVYGLSFAGLFLFSRWMMPRLLAFSSHRAEDATP